MKLVKNNEVINSVMTDINFRLKVVLKDGNSDFLVIVTIKEVL